MAYTYTRTRDIFTASESAPTAEAVVTEIGARTDPRLSIANDCGNIALTLLDQNPQRVQFDDTVEPPVLSLRGAKAFAAFGEIVDGQFKPWSGDFPRGRHVIVDGKYTGPDSEVRITTPN